MADEAGEIQKRHTLNWLIQGASQHAGLTLHHLVRDELNALDARLLPCYEEFALLVLLQYWRGLSVLVTGRPGRFWKRAASDPGHPFYGHPLLSRYGGMLAEASKLRALARCKEKGYSVLPFLFSFRAVSLVHRVSQLEAPHRAQLLDLAKHTAGTVWSIPVDRLEARLCPGPAIPASQFPADSVHARMLRNCVIGYSNVERSRQQLQVAAKGISWQLLAKELVKGTAELICLHGLTQLDDHTYQRVIESTDRIELEPWLLQSGGEVWRRLLAALPAGGSVARVLMHLARLSPAELNETLGLVIQESGAAMHQIARLAA